MRIRRRRAVAYVRALFHSGRDLFVFFSSFTTRGNITYYRKRLAKRKNEPADAHHRNVGCQERNGCKEVKERGVRPEALQGNVQSPTRSAKRYPQQEQRRVCLLIR